ERVAAFAHLGVQPRSERVLNAKVIARGAAYRDSRPVQINNGIAVRRSGSDNQTWHREMSGRAGERGGGQGDKDTGRQGDFPLLVSRSPCLPVSPSFFTASNFQIFCS